MFATVCHFIRPINSGEGSQYFKLNTEAHQRKSIFSHVRARDLIKNHQSLKKKSAK